MFVKKQLELTVNHKCDKCGEFKPRSFSYFTSRTWFCEDCSSLINKTKRDSVYNEQLNCKSFLDLIKLKQKFHND